MPLKLYGFQNGNSPAASSVAPEHEPRIVDHVDVAADHQQAGRDPGRRHHQPPGSSVRTSVRIAAVRAATRQACGSGRRPREPRCASLMAGSLLTRSRTRQGRDRQCGVQGREGPAPSWPSTRDARVTRSHVPHIARRAPLAVRPTRRAGRRRRWPGPGSRRSRRAASRSGRRPGPRSRPGSPAPAAPSGPARRRRRRRPVV